MAALSLEDRVTALESELQQLKQRQEPDQAEAEVPWWERIMGVFENDPEFEEAMRLGREYRESLRPKEGEDEAQCLF